MHRAGGYTARDQAEQLYENLDLDYQLYIRPTEATRVAEIRTKATEYERVIKNGSF